MKCHPSAVDLDSILGGSQYARHIILIIILRLKKVVVTDTEGTEFVDSFLHSF